MDNNKRQSQQKNGKSKKGISLIALIITIIVIIILAAIVIGTALTTPESANRAKFASNMAEVQHAVSIKLANNYNQFITNPDGVDLNAGFTRIPVNGAPTAFDSFALQGAETGKIGYLVRLDTIKMEPLTIGQEYKTATEVTFGTTDAFVYDAQGEVFYALGYKYDGSIYYSIADLEAGGVAVVNPSDENPSVEPSVEPSEEPEPVDPSLLAGVNIPVLGTGMKEVYWDASRNEIARGDASFDVTNWYDYIAQAGGTASGGTSKWANAKTTDGSYFVWIPRFAYKIIYYTDASLTTISGARTGYGKIDVLFMYGTSSTKYIDKATNTALDLPVGYSVHPAFRNDITKGGWDSELSGIWVAKYEVSRSNATSTSGGSGTTMKVVPQVKGWNSITIGNAFNYSKTYNLTLNSHMLKNSEWGAVAYLAYSKYGRNTSDITINNNNSITNGAYSLTGNAGASANAAASTSTYAYNTPQGILASSTGNIFGIYDMAGGLNEFVAAYWPNTSDGNFVSYGGDLVCVDGTSTKDYNSTKYSTVYSTSLASTGYIEGDATYQTQWGGDMPGFYASNNGIILRGGPYDYAGFAGVFSTTGTIGNVGANYGFRICLIP